MKQVAGIWLPDDDTHFADYLERSPRHAGAGTYQLKKIQMAMRVMPQDRRGVAVDIGAHVGLWSRVLADKFRRVLAFEPVPDLAQCFERNLSDSYNVKLVKCAISHQSGELLFCKGDGNSGNARVAPGDDPDAFHVVSARLDDLDLPSLDFLKIDVEGWESAVLAGAEQTIRKFEPVVVIEQKPDNAERYGFKRFTARSLLKSWGAKQLWEKSGDYCLGW